MHNFMLLIIHSRDSFFHWLAYIGSSKDETFIQLLMQIHPGKSNEIYLKEYKKVIDAHHYNNIGHNRETAS